MGCKSGCDPEAVWMQWPGNRSRCLPQIVNFVQSQLLPVWCVLTAAFVDLERWYSVQRRGYRLDDANRFSARIFMSLARPDRLWGTPSFLPNGYWEGGGTASHRSITSRRRMVGALHNRPDTHRYFITSASLKNFQLRSVECFGLCIHEWFGQCQACEVNKVV